MTVAELDGRDRRVGQVGPEPAGARRARGDRQLHGRSGLRGQGHRPGAGRRRAGLGTAAGYRSMQFNAVVETNTGAVHLWQSLGFEILATVPEAFDHRTRGLVGLHVMYRRL